MVTFLIVLGILAISLLVYSVFKNSKKTTETSVDSHPVLEDASFLPSPDADEKETEIRDEVILPGEELVFVLPKEDEKVLELETEKTESKSDKPAKSKSPAKKKSAKPATKKGTGAKRGRKSKKDGGDQLLHS